MHSNVQCYSCGSHGLSIFYQLENIPVHSCLLMPTRKEALEYPKRDLRLGFCHSCGFIQNTIFDPAVHEYSSRYEETQAFSPRFNQFLRDLAERVIKQYDLHGKDILEIGCGKGEFLVLLCEMGRNHGIGIDPGYIKERTKSEAASRIRFIQDFYSEKYSHLAADFLCCRHTLEHIHTTRKFLQMVRDSIGNRLDTIVFFEVPDVSRVLKEQAFWDLYYEHCSYFSLGSLGYLFRSCGFEILELTKDFDDQYLLIEARPSNGSSVGSFQIRNDLEEIARDVKQFEKTFPSRLRSWKEELHRIKEQGKRTVVWGSGSKAVAYLTTLGINSEIEYVVDINPYKHGMYLAGTGHKIVAPKFLKEYRPDTVIVMNPIYCDEIQCDLDKMGIAAEIIPV